MNTPTRIGHLADAVEIRRARWLVDRLPIIYAAGGASALGLTIGMALLQPSTALFVWALASAAYYAGCRTLNHQARRKPVDTLAAAQRWHRYTTAACIVQGMKWGAAGWFFFDSSHQASALLVLGVLISVTAGAMVLLASHPRDYTTLLLLSITPLVAALCVNGWAHGLLALLLVASAALGIHLVHHLHRGLMEAFELQLAHESLAAELADEVARAERLATEKSALLAFAGHDLRNPIAALRLFVEERARAASRSGTSASVFHHSHIHNELVAIENLLDTLIDTDATRSGDPLAPLQPVALDPLISDAAQRFHELARARSIDLRALPTHAVAQSDPVALRRILDNLVSNAIRHSQGGRIVICVRRDPAGARLEVRDSGIGLPDASRLHLLEPALATAHGSSPAHRGLGLRIVRELAAQIDATLAVRCRPHAGSVVSLAIPLASPAMTPPATNWARQHA